MISHEEKEKLISKGGDSATIRTDPEEQDPWKITLSDTELSSIESLKKRLAELRNFPGLDSDCTPYLDAIDGVIARLSTVEKEALLVELRRLLFDAHEIRNSTRLIRNQRRVIDKYDAQGRIRTVEEFRKEINRVTESCCEAGATQSDSSDNTQ